MKNEHFVDNMLIYIEKKNLKNLVMIELFDKVKNMKKTIDKICVVSFIVIIILNYVFIFIELVVIMLNI